MTTRTRAEVANATDADHCAACSIGRHHACTTSLRRCECAEQRHRPDDRVAAAMAVFHRLDLRGTDRLVMASAWRKRYPAPDDAR